ncbi:hypothetical protein GTG23_31060 [Rhodococcus hoagii]|nr:hypothetical protein [Prescottella equi]NKZ68492.1 hypothetical protein [Prescottella equi]
MHPGRARRSEDGVRGPLEQDADLLHNSLGGLDDRVLRHFPRTHTAQRRSDPELRPLRSSTVP